MTVVVEREGPYEHRCERRVECTKCGSKLRYMMPDDIEYDDFKVSGSWFTGTAKVKEKSYITCGHCGEAVFVRDH